jgi:drug/metabolite transporter (DMT)-like permease
MSELLVEESVGTRRPELEAARLAGPAVVLAVLTSALWGTNPTALKIALRGFPPIGSAGLRFAIAAVGVWWWCRLTGVRSRPQRGEGWWLGATGALFLAQIATFTLGVHWGTASHSIVLLHTYPFFVVAMAHFLIPGERTSAGRAAGLVAAFSGIVALFAGEWGKWEGTQLLGDGVQLVSAFLLGAQVVFVKHALARIDPSRLVLWEMAAGGAAFLAYSLVFEGLAGARPGGASVAAVLYQGVVIGTLCFTVWTWLLRRHAASRMAIFGFVSPLVGVLASVLALGEPLTVGLLVSAGLVAVGIVMANLW